MDADIPPPEKVLGLDPRALLARAASLPDLGRLLREWTPPAPEELAAWLPQFADFAPLGRGGMGAVYRARQPSLDRLVAIKLLPATAASDAAFAERFRLEARTLARLQHPHIVAVYESGQTSAGHLYFVMEYVEGVDLARTLAAGLLPVHRTIEIVREVCAALHYAHTRGVIHRDIKPANVLLAADGRVKIADFGLALLRADETPASTARLTQTGVAVGTRDYLAPEQADGREIDPRADLYSVGVLLYEMLTGRLPRGAWAPPSEAAKVDPRFDAIIQRALQPEPAARFPDAVALDAALAFSPAKVDRRRVLGALAAGAAVLGVGTWWWRKGEPPIAAVSADREGPDLLATLDLPGAIVEGEWRWLDEQPGGTLTVAHREELPTKLLRLPFRPDARGYDLSLQLRLSGERSNFGLALKAGEARVGVLFNYLGHCGLGLIRGSLWYENESSTPRLLPTARWLTLEIGIRPRGAEVLIAVRVDEQPFLQWAGPQSQLAILEDPPGGWRLGDREAVALATAHGGLEIREVRATLRG